MSPDRSVPPLAAQLARSLDADAAALGAHWQERARSAAPRLEEAAPVGERAEAVVRALAAELATDLGAPERVLLAGWEYGAWAHRAGLSLHVLLKELDVLLAILLFAVERALTEAPGGGGAGDGLRVARRLHRTTGTLALAAATGFTQAYLVARRGRFRSLRHDLRNPIGTIQNAVSLMQDETMTSAQRHDPRYPAMVERNARTLDAMVTRQLADDTVLDHELGVHAVALRDLALAVRRATREDAAAARCEIAVDDDTLPWVRTHAVGVELALRALHAVALRLAAPGTVLRLGGDAGPLGREGVRVVLRGEPALVVPEEAALDAARRVAEHAGARLWHEEGRLVLELPGALVQPRATPPRAGPVRGGGRSVAHAGHDVGGAREGDHP